MPSKFGLSSLSWFSRPRRTGRFRLRAYYHRGQLWTAIALIFIVGFILIALFTDRGSTKNVQEWQKLVDTLPLNSYGVALIGRRPDVDLVTGTVGITWRPYACGNFSVNPADPACQWGFAGPVDFYIDEPSTPTFTVDPDRISRSPTNVRQFIDSQNTWNFKTVHAINAATWSGHLGLEYHFPFDSFSTSILIRATMRDTNASLPIIYAAIGETPTRWSKQWENHDYGIMVLHTGEWVPSLVYSFILQRARSVMAFVMIIFLINWFLTVLVMHITFYYLAESMSLRRQPRVGNAPEVGGQGHPPSDPREVEPVPKEILLLPVSVILTIPALRSAMPSVPDYGIMLDIIGYFFNLVLIALCSMFLILLLIYQNKHPMHYQDPKDAESSPAIEGLPTDSEDSASRSSLE